MSIQDDITLKEQLFHNAVREYIIWLLLFILLYVSSYATICVYRRKVERDEYYTGNPEDAFVYRVSLWICTFALAVSAGAVLLLPISIVANEALIMFPKSYYFRWVNGSLIHGFWNQIFLASNLCLFFLMPFAYLFTESEGFPGSRKGVMGRLYETVVVLILLTILLCGIVWVASAILNADQLSRQALSDLWTFYLPYLYSCVSLLGVASLLVCTPIGFATLFTVVGDLVIKPQFLRDIEVELDTATFELNSLERKLQFDPPVSTIANGHDSQADLQIRFEDIKKDKIELEKQKKVSSLRRNLGYPLVMLLLLALTSISTLMVVQNTLELLIGAKAIRVNAQELVLGISSLSALGPVGAALEIVIILYLMITSVVGFYSLPYVSRLKPKLHDTPMTKLIVTSAVILVMSSALPVLSRTLGITNFDLIGSYGTMDWLDNLYLILSYNVLFAIATATSLINKFTFAMRKALIDRLALVFSRSSASSSDSAAHSKDD